MDKQGKIFPQTATRESEAMDGWLSEVDGRDEDRLWVGHGSLQSTQYGRSMHAH